MEIPKSPRGYWAKKRVGKNVPSNPKLLKLTPKGVNSITLHQQEQKQPISKQEPPTVEVVPGSLDAPHKLVKITRNGLHRGKSDDRGVVHSKNKQQLDIQVSRTQIDRACLVFDSLIKTLENEGIPVSLKNEDESRATQIEIDGYLIEIGIDEKIQRTKKEREEGKYIFWEDRFIFTPTGRLSIVVRSYSYGGRSSWNDGKIQRIEDCISSVVTSLKHLAPLLHRRELERVERERQWELRRQAKRRQEIDEYKGEQVLGHVKQWKLSRGLSAFLDELQAKAKDTPSLDEYISWARRYAEAINPISWPEHLVFDDEELEKDAPRTLGW